MSKILKVDFQEKEKVEYTTVDEFLNEFSSHLKTELQGKTLQKIMISCICDEGTISMHSINATVEDFIKMAAELQSKAVYYATISAISGLGGNK